MPRKPGSKQLILEYFQRNIGKVLESKDLQKASGARSSGHEGYASFAMRTATKFLLTKTVRT